MTKVQAVGRRKNEIGSLISFLSFENQRLLALMRVQKKVRYESGKTANDYYATDARNNKVCRILRLAYKRFDALMKQQEELLSK